MMKIFKGVEKLLSQRVTLYQPLITKLVSATEIIRNLWKNQGNAAKANELQLLVIIFNIAWNKPDFTSLKYYSQKPQKQSNLCK